MSFGARRAAPATGGQRLPLSLKEQSTLLGLIGSLLDVETAADFEGWSAGPLQALLPHAMMICGLAEIRPQQINIRKVIVHEWPLAYLDALRQPDGSFYSPIMNRWNERHAPQLYEPYADVATSAQHRHWQEVFHDYGLRNIASHGVHDVAGSVTSYFNFSSIPGALDARTAGLLELLTPHMHLALTRALSNVPLLLPGDANERPTLTVRERDVLHWMLEGKTNWEIGQISGRSEHTIKHQVERILDKLDANNRAQAVAKAISLGLIA
jgi:LuxR family transcriptional regulator, quorum-sensing system regulator CviR